MKYTRRLARLEQQAQEQQETDWMTQAFATVADYEAALAGGNVSANGLVIIGVDVDMAVGRKPGCQ